MRSSVAWRVGLGFACLGVLATVALGVGDALQWMTTAGDPPTDLVVRRGLFAIATAVDRPLLQFAAAGAAAALFARFRQQSLS
ncbi:hypothetical protein [Pseudobythopirellula maris]|uniref:hypothetical protein n=1 Tax=Pseudobythopirellula maris TaxID=2527991 RepID=UPI0011B54DCB|nr:hypothetical protein [Pseudobythopirellula maris]